MDILGILYPDPNKNSCGSETLKFIKITTFLLQLIQRRYEYRYENCAHLDLILSVLSSSARYHFFLTSCSTWSVLCSEADLSCFSISAHTGHTVNE